MSIFLKKNKIMINWRKNVEKNNKGKFFYFFLKEKEYKKNKLSKIFLNYLTSDN